MKLTDWYSGDQKPVRIGAYERDYESPYSRYSWWNGKEFGVGYFDLSKCLFKQMGPMIAPNQNLRWRGIKKITDAEYLNNMAEFVPPWHQERVKQIAKRLEDPRSAIAQSILEFALNPYHRCDVAYEVICAHQYNWGEWEDSFYGDKEERIQGRVFCLIVAEALS